MILLLYFLYSFIFFFIYFSCKYIFLLILRLQAAGGRGRGCNVNNFGALLFDRKQSLMRADTSKMPDIDVVTSEEGTLLGVRHVGLNMLSWYTVRVNQTNARSRGLWEKRHILLIFLIVRQYRFSLWTARLVFSKSHVQTHAHVPITGNWIQLLTCINCAFDIRVTRMENDVSFVCYSAVCSSLAVLTDAAHECWVDCECNGVVWAVSLPSAVLECLYIKRNLSSIVLMLNKNKQNRQV